MPNTSSVYGMTGSASSSNGVCTLTILLDLSKMIHLFFFWKSFYLQIEKMKNVNNQFVHH